LQKDSDLFFLRRIRIYMEIVSSLKGATANEIVRLDIGAGNEWWVTRLLALSVGVVRAGSPKPLVFVGQRPDLDNAFLGWANPSALLQSLMPDISPPDVMPANSCSLDFFLQARHRAAVAQALRPAYRHSLLLFGSTGRDRRGKPG